MRGRKPKDSILRMLHGNPGKRPIEESGSDPFLRETVVMPNGLSGLETQEWDRLAETLAPLLSRASEGMLRAACSALAQFVEADRIVQAQGMFYETCGEAGRVIRQHPAVKVRDAARLAYIRALTELGGSPVARSRVRRLPEKKTAEQKRTGTSAFFT